MSGAAREIISTPSPNFGPRRDDATPSLIVLHYTAMSGAQAALQRLCDPQAEVSAHYLISAQGDVHQMVEEDQRAWHAGAGQWGAITDVNSHSIGIELDNLGDHPFAEPQMAALEWLLPRIMRRWDIAAAGVIGHSDMAPSRKSDPGPRFDWRRLAQQGLALWPGAPQVAPESWDEAARGFGYPDDPKTHTAFRARFRPWATGPLDDQDLRILAALPPLGTA
jgi:N-acetylmuramoyl-L-alanine amidase